MRTGSIVALFAVLGLCGCSKPEPLAQTHQGRIETGDSVLEADNSLYDEYKFSAAEGMTITATMVSTEFDTYLHLVGPDHNQLAQNDDDASMGPGAGGNALNSKITFVAPATGEYSVLANTRDQGQTGAYTVTITTTAAGAAPAAPAAPAP